MTASALNWIRKQSPWRTALMLYLVAQTFFLLMVQFPSKRNFDEFHYIPSAQQWLDLRENQNWEHPPLAKELIAVGVGVFGDRPIGWRFMSTVFGALTLAGMYILAFAIFAEADIALWVALLTLFNQLLYVQARIAMLDTFMMAFMTWGLAAFCWSIRAKTTGTKITQFRVLQFAGVMFGLAIACKWMAIFAWVPLMGLVLVIKLFQSWGVTFSSQAQITQAAGKKKQQLTDTLSQDWYDPLLWKEIRNVEWVWALFILPVLAYFVTFVPYFFVDRTPHYNIFDLIPMQLKMWDGQQGVVNCHPYMSQWYQWPLLNRPIWYAFDKEGPAGEWVRGVLMIGNPWIMWTGLIGLGFCTWGWVRERSREAFFPLFFWCCFYGCWLVIPRKISFYYYYYPAGMMLSLVMAYAFKRFGKKQSVSRWMYLAVAAAVFFYFFPILSGLKIVGDSYTRWMWFRSWI